MMCQVTYAMSLKSDNYYLNCYSYSYMERGIINSISYISSSHMLGCTNITYGLVGKQIASVSPECLCLGSWGLRIYMIQAP